MELKVVDCRGKRCPIPIIESAKKIHSLNNGEKFLLISDDPATQTDLLAWARMTGHHVDVMNREEFIVTARKNTLAS